MRWMGRGGEGGGMEWGGWGGRGKVEEWNEVDGEVVIFRNNIEPTWIRIVINIYARLR